MKIIFCISIFIVCLIVLLCDFITFKKNVKLSNTVCLVLSIGFFTLISNALSIVFANENTSENLSDFFMGCYFFSIDWLLIALVEFCFVATDKKRLIQNNRFYKTTSNIIAIFILADTFSILLNNFLHNAFSSVLNQETRFGFYYRTYTFFKGFNFHLGICYFLVAVVFYVLISSIWQCPLYQRIGFIHIVVGFLLIIITNILYLVQQWKMDYSILFYGLLTITICYFSIYSFERKKFNLMTVLYAESIKSAVFCFDYEKNCIYINHKAYEILDGEKQVQNISKEYLNNPWIKKGIKGTSDLITGNESFYINNEIHYFYVEYRIFRDKKNKEIGSYLRFTDRTNEIIKANTEKLNATHDPLTGLLNKSTFFQKTEEIIRSNPSVVRYLVVTNICDFKFINDVFGTEIGDKILKEQARMLSFAKYNDCICGRISSDRYAMLIKKENYNENLAKQNTDQLQEITKSLNYRLKIKIGIYQITGINESVESMYDRANLALDSKYNSKENLINYYDDELMEKVLTEKKIQSSFQQALDSKELTIVYQPVFENDKPTSYEALSRWKSSEMEKIAPKDYIHVLEQSISIYQLDFSVWNQVCSFIKENMEKGKELHVSVNLSPLDFYYSNLYSDFTGLVDKWGIKPENLLLEIPESIISNNKKDNLETIQELHKAGFDFIFDNFGNGFISLFALNEIKPKYIKIDVTKLDSDEKNIKIIKNIIETCQKLDVNVIAKKVENQKIFEIIKDVNCNIYQGNYFSKPIGPEEI